MVGVPGRSRACLVCKSRRIKCDLRQPECGQCARGKRDCAYAKKHIFVNHDDGGHKTMYRKATCVKEPEKGKRNDQTTSSTPDRTDTLVGSPPRERSLVHVIERPVGTLNVLRQQLLADACDYEAVQTTDRLAARPWTFALSAFAGSVHALNSGPLGCYTAWIGRRKREPYLVEASRRLYIQGLKEVQAAVNDSSKALLDETLGAILSLIGYEALECPDRSRGGYKAHVEGCARIVQLRGASMHQSGAAHELFRAYRYIGLLHDLSNHKPSFLASHSWTTLPWIAQPKNMYDRLLDLVALAPGVLENSDKLSQTPPDRFLPALLELSEEVRAADIKLVAFYDELVASSPDPLYWEEPTRMENLDDSIASISSPSIVDDCDLHFRDMEAARILTLYWAMLALSWSGLTDLHQGITELLLSNAIPDALVPIVQSLSIQAKDWRIPVRKVVQSITYCTSGQKTTDQGHLVIKVPLDIVIDVMRHRQGCEMEFAKAVKANKEIAANWLQISRYSEGGRTTT